MLACLVDDVWLIYPSGEWAKGGKHTTCKEELQASQLISAVRSLRTLYTKSESSQPSSRRAVGLEASSLFHR